jgi:hypothetical protein
MIVSVVAFWMVATLMPTNASAQEPTIGGFRIRIEQLTPAGTGPGVVILDEGAGDTPGEAGAIIFSGPFGTVTSSFTSGFSKPNPNINAVDFLAEMKLTSFMMSSTSAATVRLTLEDTDYAGHSGFLRVQDSVTNAFLSAGATITTQSWVAALPPDLGHLQPTPGTLGAMSTILDDGALIMDSTSGITASSLADFQTNGLPYALFTQVVISFGDGGGMVSFDQDTTVNPSNGGLIVATPEPGSLMFIALGVVGLGFRMRRSVFTRA